MVVSSTWASQPLGPKSFAGSKDFLPLFFTIPLVGGLVWCLEGRLSQSQKQLGSNCKPPSRGRLTGCERPPETNLPPMTWAPWPSSPRPQPRSLALNGGDRIEDLHRAGGHGLGDGRLPPAELHPRGSPRRRSAKSSRSRPQLSHNQNRFG